MDKQAFENLKAGQHVILNDATALPEHAPFIWKRGEVMAWEGKCAPYVGVSFGDSFFYIHPYCLDLIDDEPLPLPG